MVDYGTRRTGRYVTLVRGKPGVIHPMPRDDSPGVLPEHAASPMLGKARVSRREAERREAETKAGWTPDVDTGDDWPDTSAGPVNVPCGFTRALRYAAERFRRMQYDRGIDYAGIDACNALAR